MMVDPVPILWLIGLGGTVLAVAALPEARRENKRLNHRTDAEIVPFRRSAPTRGDLGDRW